MSKTLVVAVCSALLLVLAVGTASAAYEFYMKIDGIPGPVATQGHQQWIGILSWQWGVGQPMTVPSGVPAQADLDKGPLAKAQGIGGRGQVTITKQCDASSPKLFMACMQGIPSPMLTIDASLKGGPKTMITYKLTNVIITRMLLRGSGDKAGVGEKLPLEEVTLTYDSISWTADPAGWAPPLIRLP
jgi:type VI secretion system secreted protein Hcp